MQLPQHFLSVCQPCYFAFFNSKSFFNIFPQMLCRSLNVLLKSFGFFILSVLYSLDFSDCFHFSTPVNNLYQIKCNLYKVLQFLQNDISLFLRFFLLFNSRHQPIKVYFLGALFFQFIYFSITFFVFIKVTTSTFNF